MPNYENALSRQFGEGGYTFLKRVLEQQVVTNKPQIINIGQAYLKYEFTRDHTNFSDGITVLKKNNDDNSIKLFNEVANRYKVTQGINELQTEGKLPTNSHATRF